MNNKQKVLIFGCGDFAELISYYINHDSEDLLVEAFVVDDSYLNEGEKSSIKILKWSDVMNNYPPADYQFLLGVGYRSMRDREVLFNKIKQKGFDFANYIHSSVRLNNAKFGQGNIVLMNVTIEPFVEIGDNNVIWSDTLLGHHAIINSHNYIAAKCLIGGKTVTEDGCFIGNGVTTINSLNFSKETYLVAGSVILSNTESYSMYYGNPAKLIKKHEKNGIRIR
jgi:sugar O-acyltransferase (sialic acid O-acetyltransferase NeuD family)